MTQNEFQSYLVFVAIFAGALGVANLLRPQKRWLGAGAVLLGIATLLYRQATPMPVVAVVCGLAAFCMAKDVMSRQRRKAS